ncbi:DUF5990 family protein [Streptomyces sp. NPDC127038]|uniref:DUF5990 family protein n=1 Tax=Streptomyces sp. NPDC127038 TaxID=3347114 RepID=UPI003664786F
MHIRIDADDLPGRTCPAPEGRGTGAAYDNIHLAVQRRDRPAELLDPQPGDGASATWTLPCAAAPSPEGLELTGPYVQYRLGHRFIYLSWGTVDEAGVFSMFRRAKLMLDAVPADVLTAAAHEGLLVGRLGLTDSHGNPRCARVVPPDITWTAEAEIAA